MNAFVEQVGSDLGIALHLADEGAQVVYVVPHRNEIEGIVRVVADIEGVKKVYRTNGNQRVIMNGGGVVRLLAPNASVRGSSYAAVFAPPSVWNDENRREELALTTLGSTFFHPHPPLMFSTFQRIDPETW